MANPNKQTIADVRRDVPDKAKGNSKNSPSVSGNSVNVRGPPAFRNKTLIPDSMIDTEVNRAKESIRSEFPGRSISFDQKGAAQEAMRYLSYIRAAFLVREEDGPLSVSHARRYSYDDAQLRYWRDQMIDALQEI